MRTRGWPPKAVTLMPWGVGMKPLSERDENHVLRRKLPYTHLHVGMKPLSERDENLVKPSGVLYIMDTGRNEATL